MSACAGSASYGLCARQGKWDNEQGEGACRMLGSYTGGLIQRASSCAKSPGYEGHFMFFECKDYAAADPKCRLNHDKQRQKSADKGSSPTIPSHIRAMLGRTLQISNDHASARLFSTAALGMRPQATPNHTSRRLFGTTALTLLKVLKKA
ncbi:hypothetical protein SETIT_5G249700v2 [Setaria italica]|uniref:Uncharacterized protein n=1 Tax=Setaria italica TaxID=4555 RepID=A0A368R8H7_SETIT|nr:hypothetical protein SETIT_5G249700v2 [Setaria italica]